MGKRHHIRIASQAVIYAGFVAVVNSVGFAFFFFKSQGMALDDTKITQNGHFLLAPTLSEHFLGFTWIFSGFLASAFLVSFLLIFFFGTRLTNIFFLCASSIVLSLSILFWSKSIFILDPDFQITQGIAAGSVNPLAVYIFVAKISITSMIAIAVIIAVFKLLNRRAGKEK